MYVLHANTLLVNKQSTANHMSMGIGDSGPHFHMTPPGGKNVLSFMKMFHWCCYGSLGKYQFWKRYLLLYARVLHVT